mmetsp:Transcript_9379/g.28478  ORF Transcript_9379/g.28478 Transcript_9379/m.28478 type:complete len:94 (-) Transcript_9379:918-1199(-)
MRDTVQGGPASRLMRSNLKLSEYRFTVEHQPGANHKDADGVSRLVAADERTPVVSDSQQGGKQPIAAATRDAATTVAAIPPSQRTTTAHSLHG